MNTIASVEFHYSLFTHQNTTWPPLPNRSEEKEKETYQPLLNIKIWKLHGDLDQKVRTETYNTFIQSTGGILICTDVAARGLDLPNIDWIIQYDPPPLPAEYIHRVGRTARAGGRGRSVIFLTSTELKYLEHLHLKNVKGKNVPLSKIELPAIFRSLDHPKLKLEILTNKDDNDDEENQITNKTQRPLTRRIPPAALLHRCFEELILLNKLSLMKLAEDGFQSYTRSYATYPKFLKSIFHLKYLHLGHVARSFGLKEKPSIIRPNQNKQQKMNNSQRNTKKTFKSEKNVKKKNYGMDQKEKNNNKKNIIIIMMIAIIIIMLLIRILKL